MNTQRKVTVYLADLVHNYLGVGTYMFPLNIGYLAAYAKKHFGDRLDIRLFKYPADVLAACTQQMPDIIGFTNYTWNADLNEKMSRWIKQRSEKTVIVYGGPNINYSTEGYTSFFRTHPAADFYIPYQGETPFITLLKALLDTGVDVHGTQREALAGVVFCRRPDLTPVVGAPCARIKDLDSIPSPYLTGLLDQFFETNLIPIVETNRGCPYTCTFCAQGYSSHNRMEFFSMDRVKEELRYIAAHVKNTNILNFADSNFCIVERDMEIAEFIASLGKTAGYPRKFSTNWAKNQPRIFEIARILENANLVVSLQSLDRLVLKNVRRSNIEISVFKDIVQKVNDCGGMSGTEIILGLPGETKQSHVDTIRQLFDWNVSYIICYNALLLDGTEMAAMKEQGRWLCATKFRLIDNSFGAYDDFKSFESEEGIRSTDCMSEDDILYFRPVHWMIQFLWNYRFYYDLLKYFQRQGHNPVDFILSLIDRHVQLPAHDPVRRVIESFNHEARDEWFETPAALQEHYSAPEQFEALRRGEHGKLNGKYIFKVLMADKAAFEGFILDSARQFALEAASDAGILSDIMQYLSSQIIDFSQPWDAILLDRVITLNHDVHQWRKSNYSIDLSSLRRQVRYRLYLPADQADALQKLFKQYQHENKNVTLRKMSEYMAIKDFFYGIEPL